MRRYILRGLGIAGGVVLVLVLVAGGLYLIFDRKFTPTAPTADFPAPRSALEAQQQDLSQFARLVALDRSYSPQARAEAEKRIAALEAEQTPLDSAHFRVVLQGIVALADNGHTRLYSSDNSGSNILPIRVTQFSDGVYVMWAEDAERDLPGARVEQIEGHPVANALAKLDTLQGGVPGWRRMYAMIYLQSPEMLFGAGLAAHPDRATWTFKLPGGATVTRVLQAEPYNDNQPRQQYTRWLSPEPMGKQAKGWHTLAGSDAELPLSWQDFGHSFRRLRLDRSCTLYMQMKAVEDVGNEHIADYLQESENDMRAHAPCALILDLRYNGGGDYTNTYSFAKRLPDLLAPGAHVYLLTSHQTFSAAITTTSFVKQAMGARAAILGEHVGDRLAFWAEGNEGCLPHAQLCMHYATGKHDYHAPCTDWHSCYWLNWFFPVRVATLDPDETITTSFADYMAHRDPVYSRAVALAEVRK